MHLMGFFPLMTNDHSENQYLKHFITIYVLWIGTEITNYVEWHVNQLI